MLMKGDLFNTFYRFRQKMKLSNNNKQHTT